MGCVCKLFSLTLIGESMSVGYIDTSAALQGRRSRRSGSHGCTLLSYSKQSLQQNQSLKPLELLRCLRCDVLPVLSLNGPRSVSTRSPIPLKTNRRFSLARKGFASTVEEEKLSFASPKKLDSSVCHDVLPPCVIYTFASLFCRSLPFFCSVLAMFRSGSIHML